MPDWVNEAGRRTGGALDANAETPLMTQSEGLLAGNVLRLFGRPFDAFVLDAAKLPPRLVDPARKPGLARIYGFSWQGNYFKMRQPAVFVVYGPGAEVRPGSEPGPQFDQSGIEFQDEFFSQQVLMWTAYDADFGVRIDIAGGWLSEILIAAEANEASNVTGTGDGTTERSQVTARISMAARHSMVGRPPNT